MSKALGTAHAVTLQIYRNLFSGWATNFI